MFKTNLLSFLLSFFILVPLSLSASDRQVGKFRKNKIYYCAAEENKVSIRRLDLSGELISEKTLRRAKVRKVIAKLRIKANRLDERRQISNLKINRKQKIKEKVERLVVLRQNLRKCIFGNDNSDQDFAPDLVDPDALPGQDIDFNHTADLTGQISGECQLYGQKISAIPTGVTSPLLAPLSGSLKCSLSNNPNRDLLLRIFANNSSTNPELVLSEVVQQNKINQDNVFYVTLCNDRPGCFRSKKVIAALQTTGVTVKLEAR